MIVFPAIDILDGQAVRLYQGDYQQKTVYEDNPLRAAQRFEMDGATHLHLVDLDGAKEGLTRNFDTITRVVRESGLFVQLGGGIRDMQSAQKYLNCGVGRIILGTAAVEDPGFLKEAVQAFGDKLAVGVDIRDGQVATKGWTHTSTLGMEDLLDSLSELGVATLIATDISRDGAMRGTNLSLYAQITRQWGFQVIASGGVTTLKDVEALNDLDLYGVIIGRALYTGDIALTDALEVVK
ncbi:MAG: 1-(5-phosphoribosyl)-5-[(5-phosphoribosylamino)methylideneamino]imidazole-4-carboxamide isomerase [Clostridiales bacterium]|nr:1-(5-phosphoribosyl)-5-[(5-phosphoribosylamino)methylideneamino]imidazole-4-carboxamide isomerase [Clostridiales bacterium]